MYNQCHLCLISQNILNANICPAGRFSIECRKKSLNCFGFALLRSVIGLKKLAPPTQPIRYKTKTNRDLVARIFPRLAQVTCICFGLSLCCLRLLRLVILTALALVLRHSVENRSICCITLLFALRRKLRS